MQIETNTSYVIAGASFQTEKAARQWIADQVGRTIDKALSDAGKALGPGNAIALNDAIMKNAATLAVLLAAFVAPVSES